MVASLCGTRRSSIPELSGQNPPKASNLEPEGSSEAFQKQRRWDFRKDLFVSRKGAELLRFKSTNLQVGASPRADPTPGGALATRDYCFKLTVSSRSLENGRVAESARPLQQPLDPFRIWKGEQMLLKDEKRGKEKRHLGRTRCEEPTFLKVSAMRCL